MLYISGWIRSNIQFDLKYLSYLNYPLWVLDEGPYVVSTREWIRLPLSEDVTHSGAWYLFQGTSTHPCLQHVQCYSITIFFYHESTQMCIFWIWINGFQSDIMYSNLTKNFCWSTTPEIAYIVYLDGFYLIDILDMFATIDGWHPSGVLQW